ncbi:hypothetical protein GOARA_050_00310 [Gordonia araii NBRC 100433]|uniref:Uncharacterized protein n=1 Tax=Gordonia araii NBRC 100433 TaxID=1073574 RepID=G7H294_9ACTN|nr:hypothetical protein [Gordonia araii]NNG97508.1 hypothetical protein [Gordonia araii NBRC 100433]GAB09969.1 hypothetical protein GOARA_050_00310 [Gordonia araii NBRC 100433]
MWTELADWDELAGAAKRLIWTYLFVGSMIALWVYQGRSPDNSVEAPIDVYATGAAPLLALLRFYLDHPEARDELDDGRAHRRLRDGEI